MEAIIIGGGIIGIASARALLDHGVAVTVLEKDHLGSGATGLGGGVRTQFSTPANVRMSLASLETWQEFESTFGMDIRTRQLGYLLLSREESTARRIRADIETQRELGVENRFLSPTEAAEICPGLNVETFIGGGYSPNDVFVDANLALQGFADRVRELGGDIQTGTEVTDLRISASNGQLEGVLTAGGQSYAPDVVVNAAGAWGDEVAGMAGLELPVLPQLRRQLLVEPDGSFPPLHPLTMDLDSGFVFYPEDETTMIVSGQMGPMQTVDPDAYQTEIDLDWTRTVLEGVRELAGYFGPETTTLERIAGVYSMTPDHNPIIEETLPGLINAIGFSGHGFMHAPATGQMVAELATSGTQSVVAPDAFSSNRFENQSDDERAFI